MKTYKILINIIRVLHSPFLLLFYYIEDNYILCMHIFMCITNKQTKKVLVYFVFLYETVLVRGEMDSLTRPPHTRVLSRSLLVALSERRRSCWGGGMTMVHQSHIKKANERHPVAHTRPYLMHRESAKSVKLSFHFILKKSLKKKKSILLDKPFRVLLNTGKWAKSDKTL